MHDENLDLLFNNKDKVFFIDIINNSFPNFKELLTNKFIRFNKLDSFVPQGVCSVLDYTIVSLYDADFEFCSKLSIYNSNGFIKDVYLDLPVGSHVGGIAYDSINNNIWVALEKGKVGVFNYNSIFDENAGKMICPIKTFSTNIKDENNKKVSSYLTYFNNKLFVGSFNIKKEGCVRCYNIDSNGIDLVLENEFSVPNKVQGISFYNKDNVIYYAISCSYGRRNPSYIKIYKYHNNELINEFKLPPMLEQITFNDNGTLKCVFESSASKYKVNNNHKIKVTVEIPAIVNLDIFNNIS